MSDLVNRGAEPPIGWSAKQATNVACLLWAGLRASLSTHRRRWIEAIVYAELSKLSNSELVRRGIAPGDLHRLVSEMDER